MEKVNNFLYFGGCFDNFIWKKPLKVINVDSFYGICIDDKLNNYVDIELGMKEDSVMRITIQFNSIQFFLLNNSLK